MSSRARSWYVVRWFGVWVPTCFALGSVWQVVVQVRAHDASWLSWASIGLFAVALLAVQWDRVPVAVVRAVLAAPLTSFLTLVGLYLESNRQVAGAMLVSLVFLGTGLGATVVADLHRGVRERAAERAHLEATVTQLRRTRPCPHRTAQLAAHRGRRSAITAP